MYSISHTAATELKFLKEGAKRLAAYQKTATLLCEQSTQLSAYFHEFSEALAEEGPDDPTKDASLFFDTDTREREKKKAKHNQQRHCLSFACFHQRQQPQ